MKPTDVQGKASDAITVRRVFAEPFEKVGLSVIAAAAVTGGAGGGSGTDPQGQQGEGAAGLIVVAYLLGRPRAMRPKPPKA